MNYSGNNENNNQILDNSYNLGFNSNENENNIINQNNPNNLNYINQINMNPISQMHANQPIMNQMDYNQINMDQMNNNQINMNQMNNNNQINMDQMNNNNQINMDQMNNSQSNMNLLNSNEFNNIQINNNQDNMNTPFGCEMNNTPMDNNQIFNNINQMNDNNQINMNSINCNNMNQINNKQANMNNVNQYNLTPGVDMNNFYVDECPEIKEEEKKLIIFSRNDKNKIGVKIPKSFKNNKLYSIAEKYKMYKYSEMLLFHKGNYYLVNNETPIDKILNGDEIVIAENLDSFDGSNYKKYSEKYSGESKINVIFTSSLGKKRVMPFIADTTIKEIIKIYFIEEKIPENARKNYKFLHSSNSLDINDESTLREKSTDLQFLVEVNEIKHRKSIKGKKIKISIKNNYKLISEFEVGTLEKIKDFYQEVENTFLIDKGHIEKATINGKEINKDDERTFGDFGIKKDSTCKVKFQNDIDDIFSKIKNCLII